MASSHVPVRGDALAKTAGFCGWIWIFFALVGNLGEAGSHVSKLREVGVEYLLNVGGADWAYLVTIAAIPALLFALWGAKRAHRRGAGAPPQARWAPSGNLKQLQRTTDNPACRCGAATITMTCASS